MALIRRFVVAVVVALLGSGALWYGSALTGHSADISAIFNSPPRSVVNVAKLPGNVSIRKREVRPAKVPLTIDTTVLAYPPPPIQARAAVLMDEATGRVLFAKNGDQPLPIASTTKITTAVVALQHSRLNDLVSVSKAAESVGESTMVLQAGERLTVRQLVYGLMLNSANDAAVALAEHVGHSQGRFVSMMNDLAHALRLRHTHYSTPHGLDTPHHYSSALDMAVMARYALRDPTFRRIVAAPNYHVAKSRHNHEHWLANINRVMFWYPGIDGVKPGDTDAAGLCQVVSVRRDGKRLLAVLLNTPTLHIDIRNLLNYGLRDFRWVRAPIWTDTPTSALSGRDGGGWWRYYFAAGHYIRGNFLDYFNTHGGLQTFGYPRTEPIDEDGRTVQYFQGGELAWDARHHNVYPVNIGPFLTHALAPFAARSHEPIASQLQGTYKRLGGKGVFGVPASYLARVKGDAVQFFTYGALSTANPGAVVPAGDEVLRLKGWLPAPGASDVYPPTMNASSVVAITKPHAARHHPKRSTKHPAGSRHATSHH